MIPVWKEFELSGRWYVSNPKCNIENKWWVPCNILGLTPADYVHLLIDTFAAKNFRYNNDVLIFSFESEAAARKWKNYLNKQARDKKFDI